jgi:hypothetical protein
MSTNKTAPATASPEPESFDEVMRSLQRSIALVVDSPALNMSRTVNQLVNDVANRHQEMFRILANNVPKIVFPSTTLYLTHLPQKHVPQSVEVELVGSSDLLATNVIASTKQTPKQKSERKKVAFGLYLIAGNSVERRRKKLKAFSLETQHGRLLKMFLEADGHFLTDDELLAAFDKLVIRDISYILRNLKNALLANELKIIIEDRKNPDGYTLVDIQECKLTD